MRKVATIISVIMMFLISALTILFMDFYESSFYTRLKGYDVKTMSIDYNSNIDIVNITKEIENISEKYNIILLKYNNDYKNKNATNIYISVAQIDTLETLLSKNFKIKKINGERDNLSFISTFKHENPRQIGIINDLLIPNLYTYYTMDAMFENKDNLFGDYVILYTDFSCYSNFINEVSELLGYNPNFISFSSNIQSYIAMITFGCLLFLMLFYFIFQVYDYYNNSKKIGCMKLLGFSLNKINKVMLRKNIIMCFISLLIVLLLSIIFIRNITFKHLLILFLVNLLIIFMTYLISLLSCKLINKKYNISNILKMQNTTHNISKVSYAFKSIMTIMLICFSVIAYDNIKILNNKLKLYNESKNILDYGVLASYNAFGKNGFDYEKQYKLYLDIVNNFETFYARFMDRSKYTEDDFEKYIHSEMNAGRLVYDSVDINYLKKEKIKIYDINENEISLDTITSVCYLFPKNQKNVIEQFKKNHIELNEYYLQFDNNYTFKVYLYDNQKIDTYLINSKYVDGGVLRVINDTIKYQEYADGLGISTFGHGMNTGLKIKLVDNDRNKTADMLSKYIDELKLSDLFTEYSFVSYRDYFNDDILTSRLILLFVIVSVTITFTVYTLISFQLLKFYIKSRKKKILVKKLLGFKNNDIFKEIYTRNLKNTLISVAISILILVFIKKASLKIVFIPFIFLSLDFLITFISIKTINLSSVYSLLKGESYD